MNDDVPRRSPYTGHVLVVVAVILMVAAASLWLFVRSRQAPKETAMTPPLVEPSTATRVDSPAVARPATRTSADRGLGAGVASADALFNGSDIHDVPLGTILDYARKLTFDEARGGIKTLPPNEKGQTPTVKIWPEAGASSLDAATLKRGRIVARLESSGSYDNLGLAGGLNYLWVEGSPHGGYRGVIIPATAFVPLHDLDHVMVSERTLKDIPLEKGAYWVSRNGNEVPWIACGRCGNQAR